MARCISMSLGVSLLVALGRLAVAEALTFEQDVRPILKTHCLHCHGEGEQPEGGLDLRLRRWIVQGGDSGSAIDLEQPAASLLLQRVRDGEMPPEDIKKRPNADEIARIEQWISGGAKTAGMEPESIGPGLHITEQERAFWAFQPVQRPELPSVTDSGRVRTPIDRFVLARLEAAGLTFNDDASRHTLIRRLYFDLLGLPPSPSDVDAFVSDDAPDAYDRLVDRLLASPHYGERWGRHWLDVSGYADSEGATDEDTVRPDAFKYRDYVIRSWNDDKSFDQFVVEQMAGDELVSPPYAEVPAEDVEKLIATGFLRTAPDGTASGDVDQNAARNQVIADTIEIVSTSLLGLTVGCAQCHHHRYDPIAQEDYYRLRAIFEPALNWKQWKAPPARRVSLYSEVDRRRAAEIEAEAKAIDEERLKKQQEYIDHVFEQELAKLDEGIRQTVRAARDTPEKQRTDQQQQLLKQYPSVNVTASSLYLYDRKAADDLKAYADRAKAVRDTKPVESFVRATTEPVGAEPPATFVFRRGDFEQLGEQVAPAALAILASHHPVEIAVDDQHLATTGRRLAYARWLVSGRHPLTARVMANRIWLHHFGRGIVETPGDFGNLGARPTHPELLDWLADEFVRSGWSVKRLHRLMLTSTVYRQSSLRREEGDRKDIENRLYWRMNVRRLEAEALRDAVLSVSGQLVNRQFGPAVPVMADRVGQFVIGIENLNAGRPGEVIPMHGEDLRRSVYVQARRSRPLGVLAAFDLPDMTPNCTARNASTVATQSLMLMDSQFVVEHSVQFAQRVQGQVPDDLRQQLALAWRWAYGKQPDEDDLLNAKAFVNEMEAILAERKSADHAKDESGADLRQRALAHFCHALLSSNQFLYID